MTSLRRNDLAEQGAPVTDETRTFKKQHQTVDRPPVTDHNINDEYMRDPPNNLASGVGEPVADRNTWGVKEGAYEEESGEEGVLGDVASGRYKKEDVLREATEDSSVHPNASGE